ncbi:hypothetical protein R1flu_008682 [Riccia fluitans]|uniref:Uncharacterized protein n=1 Tax=Riccia fluitans TaxID=41844 RepID=A0ABD1YFZ3_9MARC
MKVRELEEDRSMPGFQAAGGTSSTKNEETRCMSCGNRARPRRKSGKKLPTKLILSMYSDSLVRAIQTLIEIDPKHHDYTGICSTAQNGSNAYVYIKHVSFPHLNPSLDYISAEHLLFTVKV